MFWCRMKYNFSVVLFSASLISNDPKTTTTKNEKQTQTIFDEIRNELTPNPEIKIK